MADVVPAALGVYQPRRPQASPLFRLVQDHLRGLQTVYDEHFAREFGPWRPVTGEVAEKFLACGVLANGFAPIRCDDCAHEYLLAFSSRPAPAADLRGRPTPLPHLPGHHADRRRHHPAPGD
jgi:hypothetical protein